MGALFVQIAYLGTAIFYQHMDTAHVPVHLDLITTRLLTIVCFLYSAERLRRSFAALVVLVLVRMEAHAQPPVRLLDLLCRRLWVHNERRSERKGR